MDVLKKKIKLPTSVKMPKLDETRESLYSDLLGFNFNLKQFCCLTCVQEHENFRKENSFTLGENALRHVQTKHSEYDNLFGSSCCAKRFNSASCMKNHARCCVIPLKDRKQHKCKLCKKYVCICHLFQFFKHLLIHLYGRGLQSHRKLIKKCFKLIFDCNAINYAYLVVKLFKQTGLIVERLTLLKPLVFKYNVESFFPKYFMY